MKKIDSGQEWTFAHIDQAYEEIRKIAVDEMGIEHYPNQIEIITSEQMLDAYATTGLPTTYAHWSFGKSFIENQKEYEAGERGLAYEIVINSDPCISYCMESNTMGMQALVVAHAAFGHNAVFKNNVHFQQWTNASAILSYSAYAKEFITECEEKYGRHHVESIIDAAHSLAGHNIDKHPRARRKTQADLDKRAIARAEHAQSDYDKLWRTIPSQTTAKKSINRYSDMSGLPESNLLYFLEQNSPTLQDWEREILQIVRRIAQYFYPQSLTKVLNEGMATYTHYTIMNRLYDKGMVTDGGMLEFMSSHTNVTMQQALNRVNPYALGFAILRDIERMSHNPTDEDHKFFPEIAGSKDHLKHIKQAVFEHKDDSFIQQYMSPKVMRDFKFVHLTDDSNEKFYRVADIHDDIGFYNLRDKVADMHNYNNMSPNIEIVAAHMMDTRELIIHYNPTHNRRLHAAQAEEVRNHMAALWGFPVVLSRVERDR